MAKKRTVWSESTYYHYLDEGRGQGTGADYKPWLTIHSFPSHGTVSRIKGRKTGRIHHLLSQNEEYYFYLLDFSPDVIDIREQYPLLGLDKTISIAQEMNIRHPRYPGCTFPMVMTTDFLVTRRDGIAARTIKMKSELDNPRVIEKFMIEREYWRREGVDWKIVTEDQINRVKVRNLLWLSSGPAPEEMVPDPNVREACISMLLLLMQEAVPFPAVIQKVEAACCLPPGSVVCIYKSLVLSGGIRKNLNEELDPGPWRR